MLSASCTYKEFSSTVRRVKEALYFPWTDFLPYPAESAATGEPHSRKAFRVAPSSQIMVFFGSQAMFDYIAEGEHR